MDRDRRLWPVDRFHDGGACMKDCRLWIV
jgi:hypothetical protein